ncbi:hypothetical protein M378DRAFT_182286 [Amanita muscaria Koide BX008]|uniref:Uncharacterized protein n=1 Tax=Amanita muscaria (strain Koide BX008) TaxID=946122 RepID=A0A0C2SML2_AMAMK|nr:hypothetical protein M378DRAFT_182286 [Amanita muscaria Koide BX008]
MTLTTKFSTLKITTSPPAKRIPSSDDEPDIKHMKAPTTAVGEGYLEQQNALRHRRAAMFKAYLAKREKLRLGHFRGLSWHYEDEPEEEEEEEDDDHDDKDEAEESKWLDCIRERAAVKAAHQMA